VRRDLTRTRTAMLFGALLGLAAGLVAATYFEVAGEPRIEQAITIEHQRAMASGTTEGHDPSATEVSRSTQRGIGLFAALGLAGAAFGALYGSLFSALRGQRDLFRRALTTGAVLATATTIVPWLKYPPNPPAVGDPSTIDRRQLLYSLLIVLTGVVLMVVLNVAKRLRDEGASEMRRWLTTAAVFVVPMAVVLTVLPPNTDPITVPASLIWEFRLVSLTGNILRWGLLSVAFGLLATSSARVTDDHDREPLVAL
jgi:hypothetical protein